MLLYIIKKEKGNPKKIYKTLKAKNKIKKLKLFDEEYYINKYPNVKSIISPLNHYLYHGYEENKQPSKIFDNNYYLKKYSDVKESGINPLAHYVLYGIEENRYKNKKEESESLEKLNSKIKTQQEKIDSLQKKLNKYTRLYEIPHINKEKVQSEIENFKEYGVKKEKRTPKLIVSLTSYPDRMYDIHYCLYSLLNQTLKPDELILWLAREQFPKLEEDIPKKVLELKKHGLSIKWCEDLKSYKKLIPTLEEYNDDIIVTADDDIYYPKDWLEQLYENYDGENVVCHRAHFINFDNNELKPYKKWIKIIQNVPSILNFATGCGGILYPPRSQFKDVCDKNLFMELAPHGDDLWFWAMTILNKRQIKVVENGYSSIVYTNPERELGLNEEPTLYNENKDGRNDKQAKNILKYYPQIVNNLINEFGPKVSIIIPVYNSEKYLKKCMDSVLNQSLKDIEIICINDGSTDDSLKVLEGYARKDNRITVISQENQGTGNARNMGIENATGEYLGFIDSDDWISKNFYEDLYINAKKTNSEISATSNVIFPETNKTKNMGFESNQELDTIEKKAPVIIYSGVTCNKIYKYDFIRKNKIKYSENNYGEDNIFNVFSVINSNKICTTNKSKYFYRQENSSNVRKILTCKELKAILNNYKDILTRLEKLSSFEEWKEIIYRRITLDFKYFFMGANKSLRKKFIVEIKYMFPKIIDALREECIKVSVIIPVYNSEKYLKKCMDSIINQTLQDIEIICINDGSTDSSLDILKEYSKKDKRIKILDRKNEGAGKSRNDGIKLAKGKYLSFLDSDDFFDLKMLEKSYNKAEKTNADIVLFKMVKYNDETKKIEEDKGVLNTKILPEKEPFSKFDIEQNFFQITNLATHTKIFRKKLILENNLEFLNLKSCNDVTFMLSALFSAKKISTIDKNFVFYRVNTNYSITKKRGQNPENIIQAHKKFLYKKNVNYMIEKYPLLKKSYDNVIKSSFFYEYRECDEKNKENFLKKAKEFLTPDRWKEFEKLINKYEWERKEITFKESKKLN